MTTARMSGDPGSHTEGGSARSFSSMLEQNAEAGPSRSSIDDVKSRPHSMSVSSVHFADMPHRKSDASLRHQALRVSENLSAAVASETSARSPRSSQPMRHASSFSHPSPAVSSPRGLMRSPVSQQAMSPPGASNTTAEGSPRGSRRRASQERRVRSEGGRPLRQNSLIANGIRPSAVTGGYESSSDDDTPDANGRSPPPVQQAGEPVKSTQTTYEFPRFQPSQSFSGSRGLHGLGIADFTRKRSLSLMTPMEGGSLSPTSRSGSDASGTKSRNRSRAGSIGLLPLRPDGGSRRGSRDLLRPSGLRASPLSASGPSFPTVPSSRLPSSRSAQLPTDKEDVFVFNSPGLNGHRDLPKDRDGNRDAPSPKTTDADRKGKGREKERMSRNGLAASLGVTTSRSGNVALTPDQINELLTDSDVASALRLMSGGSAGSAALSTPRRSEIPPDRGPSSRPFTPNNLQEPFIATAPPPVTTQSPEARAASRERKISVHSTADSHDPSSVLTGSPGRRSELDERLFRARRRRASSRITLGGEPEGGHVPFTHHVIQPPDSKSAVLEDSDEDSVPPPRANESAPLRTDSSPARALGVSDSPAPSRGTAGSKPNEGMLGKRFQSRGRLSAILGIKRRKSDASGDSKSSQVELAGSPHRPNEHADKTEAQEIVERQKAKEERDREEEMRQKEQERRESELAQERRYKALTQVAAHPHSERLAYQAGAHLQAFYNHMYDGLENPPRMNPLAVLRWKHRTEEQNRLREQWEERASREIAERIVQDKGRSPRSGFSERFSDSSRSLHIDSQRPTKANGLGYLRRTSASRPNGGLNGPGKFPAQWWRYTIEDVSAYKECKGVVDYFIPPRDTPPEQTNAEGEGIEKPSLSEDASAPIADQAQSSDKASKKGGSEVWVESQDIFVRRGHGVPSSIDGSLADNSGAPLTRMESNTGSYAPLSRTTSVETTARAHHTAQRRNSHHRHRHHHSLGGQAALAHAIKAPFEKLSSVARRQRTMPYLDGEPSDSCHDLATPSRRETMGGLHPSQSLLRRSAAAHGTASPPSGVAAATIAASSGLTAHVASAGDRSGHLNSSVRSRATDRLFRRSIGHEGSGRTSLTDDDTRQTTTSRSQQLRNGGPGHLPKPKLFLKGDRLTTKLQSLGAVPLDLIRGSMGHRQGGHDPRSPQDREAELAILEEELRREKAFRERMVEEGSRLRSAQEETVEQQLREVESDIYHDRKERLNDVRRRLDSVNHKIGTVDDTIRGSLNQMLLIKESSRRAADLTLEWPDFESLHAKYFNEPEVADEHDVAHPDGLEEQARDKGATSDARTPILQQNLQDSPRSMTTASPARLVTNNGNAARGRGGDQSNKGVALLAGSGHGLPTWSRRRDLDAAGRELVDPVTRARRALEDAREQFKKMGAMRLRAQSQLENLAAEVLLCTDQARERRPWARDTLDEITDLQRRVEHAEASLDRSLTTRLRATYFDPLTNGSAQIVSLVWKVMWFSGRVVLAFFGLYTFADDMRPLLAAMIRIMVSGIIVLIALWFHGRNAEQVIPSPGV